jgi:tetratricopeptide (TPR) repeat protein
MAAADVEGALSDPLGRAAERVEAGDPEAACAILQAALDADPGAVAVYEQLELLRQGNRRANREQAAVLAAQEDYAAAIAVLEAALRDDPMDHDLIGELLAARRIRAEQLLARGRMEQMEGGEAEEALRAAVEADPTLIEARLELRLLRARRVEHADAEAERLLAEGQMEAGVAALERAQALAPTPERRDRMGRVYTAMEFAAGMAAYNAKRYQEALFQFKKALHRDPVHAEAKRYLGFAQRFARDAPNDTLNDRFSRLE